MLTTIKRKRLVAKATQNAYYRRMTFEEIAHLEGIQACRRTLVKAFVLEGYHRRKAAKKPFLTPKHICYEGTSLQHFSIGLPHAIRV